MPPNASLGCTGAGARQRGHCAARQPAHTRQPHPPTCYRQVRACACVRACVRACHLCLSLTRGSSPCQRQKKNQPPGGLHSAVAVCAAPLSRATAILTTQRDGSVLLHVRQIQKRRAVCMCGTCRSTCDAIRGSHKQHSPLCTDSLALPLYLLLPLALPFPPLLSAQTLSLFLSIFLCLLPYPFPSRDSTRIKTAAVTQALILLQSSALKREQRENPFY